MSKANYILIIFGIIILVNCQTKENGTNKAAPENRTDTSNRDTGVAKEPLNQIDTAANRASLLLIRDNFKRIHSITKWTLVRTKELSETTEAGEAKFYYSNKQLEKIIVKRFGETFQYHTEYYLRNGQLSFALERSYEYNRPITYDTAAMRENNDTEAFDFKKSKMIEKRNYLENGKLFYQADSQNPAQPSSDLSQEQKRIIEDFESLIKLAAKQ